MISTTKKSSRTEKKMKLYKRVRTVAKSSTIALIGLFIFFGVSLILIGYKGGTSRLGQSKNFSGDLFGEFGIIIGIMCLIGAAVTVFLYFSDYSIRKIQEFVDSKYLNGKEDDILNDFDNSVKVLKNLRMGMDYMYYGKGARAYIIDYVDVDQVYYETIKVNGSKMVTLTILEYNGKVNKINTKSEEYTRRILEMLMATCSNITIGNG